MVVVELDVCMIKFKEKPVIKVGNPLFCAEVCLDESLGVKCLSVELVVVVDIGVVLTSKVVTDPVLVMEFQTA